MRRNLVLMLAVSFLLLFAGTAFAVDRVYFTEPAGDYFVPAIPGAFEIHMMFDFTSTMPVPNTQHPTGIDSLGAMVNPFIFTGSTVDSLFKKTCNTAGWFAGSAMDIFDNKICGYVDGGAGLAPDKQQVNGLRLSNPDALIAPATGYLLAVWKFWASAEGQIVCMDSTSMGANRLKWVTTSNRATFPQYAATCWTIKKIPNLPPVVTCPATKSTYHDGLTFDFDVVDPDGIVVSVVANKGTVTGPTGTTYHYSGDYDGLCSMPLGPFNLIFTATDNQQGVGVCTTVVTVENRNPAITNCPPAHLVGVVGVPVNFSFLASDLDGDPLTWSADVGTIDGSGNWTNTYGAAGSYTVNVTVKDCYNAEATCQIIVDVTAIGNTVVICADQCYNPGDLAYVYVNALGFTTEIGGFEFEIEFDPTTLYFVRAEKGAAIANWDYFTYRQLPCPSCGCCKYKLELVGIYDMPNGNDPSCVLGGELAKITFQVASDNNLRGYCLPVCFEFEDAYCTENVLSSCDGNDLMVASELYWPKDCGVYCDQFDPQYFNLIASGLDLFPDACLPAHEPLNVQKIVKFYCGAVKVCANGGECVIGDINLNGVKYEVGDAVLFASYFVKGPGVFSDFAKQSAATDVNRDGRTLTISDLVFLVRIILKDAVPLPKLTPYVNTLAVTNTAGTISANTEVPVGAALFVFKGVGTPTLSANMEMLYNSNGTETRVLVWSSNGKSFSSGDVFSISGNVELTSIEAADQIGNALNTTFSKGIAKADKFELSANYPNPFNLKTTISFAIKTDAKVSLKVYNVSGQYVKTLVDETMSAGSYTTTWDGTNYAGEVVSSGIYFYKMIAGGFSSTQKMVLLK
jgi:hypothetical protein